MKKSITGVQRAYITPSTDYTFQEIIERNDPCAFSLTETDMDDYPGWTFIGLATVTVEIDVNEDEVVAAQVESYNKMIDQINLEAGKKIADVKERIAKITSIGYSRPTYASNDGDVVDAEITDIEINGAF